MKASSEVPLRPFGEKPPPFGLVALVLGAIGLSRLLVVAASPGEIDEAVFAGAVLQFDLFALSPQAPGFPVWIWIGRALRPLFVSPHLALSVASAALAAVAFPALYAWGRRLVGEWPALGAALFGASLPVVWVNGSRAFSDTPATAFFLVSLALLSAAVELPARRATRRLEEASSRRARLLALGAGLAAAAGAGVRPHLVVAFGPLLLVLAWRLHGPARRRDAAWTFLGVGAAGSLLWLGWLLVQAGGSAGLFASLGERAEFRAHAFATGTFGTLLDSFLVRDFLSARRAAAAFAFAGVGFVWLARRSGRAAFELALVLVPTFLSLWFLHSRAMSRYSVPFVLVLSLAVVAGLAAVASRLPFVRPAAAGKVGFLGAALLALLFGREAWPEARRNAAEESPPAAAIAALSRYAHPGRETIVADDVFQPFLRYERWEGRLGAWGYLDSELLGAPRLANPRLVRLADFTLEVEAVDRRDRAWRTWFHGGRTAERLGNGRLLAVSVRDPAPPLFGVGFGVKERVPGRPSFRWSGRTARLLVPGDFGPPVALLSGERPAGSPPTRLVVADAASGRVVVTRVVAPGPFELAIVDGPLVGPLRAPREFAISCDAPVALPRLAGATRPREGCFVFRDATESVAPEAIWERYGPEVFLDVGGAEDRRAGPEGFFERERIERDGLDMRWTSDRASVVWMPLPGFRPTALGLRARPPGEDAVVVSVFVGGEDVGAIRVEPGDFALRWLALPPKAAAALTGAAPVPIELRSPTFSPERAGTGRDPRALGVAVDRIVLR